MIDAALRDALAGFDKAALAALGNAGLVRRAQRDVEEGKLALIAAAPGKAEVQADGMTVSIDTRGPRASVCACKALPMCRHRIAAVLFLQGLDASEAETDSDPQEIIAALDPAALQKWAGKPSWRAALELLAGAGLVEAQGNAVLVAFADEDEPVRILRGQGFDGIVSKAAKARQKALHTAAVLAARRHFGLALPDLEPAEEPAATRPDADPAFLARIAIALGEVAALGFNLAPVPLEESLFELSVSSRADSLPRLAAILRAIAAQVRLRRGRSLAFDPDRMLELSATAYALTRALAANQPERSIALAGKVRRDFAPAPPLELIGCGGERWRTPNGARGVTAWFLEQQSGQWLSTTLARGSGQDPAFNPGDAWRSQVMWQAAPLAELARAHFTLEGAHMSADGRLSAPADSKAQIAARKVRIQEQQAGAISDWGELRHTFQSQSGLGLETSTAPAACLLAPSQVGLPYFDELAQQLVWPLRDAQGAWLALTLDHEEPVSIAIEAMESVMRDNWRGMVLAKLSREGDRLLVTPITLLGEGDPVDLTLWRPQYNPNKPTISWFDRLRLRSNRNFARTPRGGTQAVLASAWRQLLDRAEAGPGLAVTLDAGLSARAGQIDSYGMPALAGLLRNSGTADGLLAAAWGVLVARQQRVEIPLLE